MEMLANLTVVGTLLLLALVIAWIVLPFAVIGTKPLLREIRDELRTANRHLARMAQAVDQGADRAP